MTYKYKTVIDDDLYKWRSLWGTGPDELKVLLNRKPNSNIVTKSLFYGGN